MIDWSKYPTLNGRLGEQVRGLKKAASKTVLEKKGWLAYTLITPEAGFIDDDYSMLERCMGVVPADFDAGRLLIADSVDSAFAELLVLGGLAARFPGKVAYEEERTEKGRTPDISLRHDKVVFEVRSLGMWGPGQAMEKLANIVRRKLRANRVNGRVTIRPSEPVDVADHHEVADVVVTRVTEFFRKGISYRFRVDLRQTEDATGPAASPMRQLLRQLNGPHLTVKYEHGSELSVRDQPPAMTPITGTAASEFADHQNASIKAIAAVAEGKSIVDHVRRLLKKKTNRQLLPGWSNFVVLVQRIENMPHVPWEHVLPDALEGDSILQIPLEGDEQMSTLVLDDTGAWRDGKNTRLSGAIGITINCHGFVQEFFGHTREDQPLPPHILELLSLRCTSSDLKRLPDLLAGP